MASLSNPATFSFNGATFTVTSVSVESATPEIVNMTSAADGAGARVYVPTGAYTSPGRISVEGMGSSAPAIGSMGDATLSTPAGTYTRRCICESSSFDARVGDVLRIRFSLMPTDYNPAP